MKHRLPVFLLAALVFGGLTACDTTQAPPYHPPSRGSMAAPAPAKTGAPRARPSAQMPRVMILVDEQSLGTIPTAEVEAMAIRMLLDQGVQVVDQDMTQSNLAKGQELFRMAGDNRGAAALGLQFGADVILIGEVVAKPSARRISDSNLRSYQAVATLRAVRTDNSVTMASASEDATVIGLEDVVGSAKAIRAAGQKSLEQIIPAMLQSWVRSGGKSTPQLLHVTLHVGGVDQLWKLRAIREQLKGMPREATDIVQRSYTTGAAVFELDSLVAIEELAEAIVLHPPADIQFQVLDIGASSIHLKIVSP
ncbi:MAG TPA: hypothetical protein PLD40_02550 [Kiritimatiellia bacterium]|jgi:hypothetical protein|nr:hypothetical protein [Kiritimatiellia bacterium]OQC59778.1 MAG: hypothetical protein BWX54_00485 [Verrucomicrobia bacterium ADurb.Bin018]MBP9572948.1 hypothetical protein [Kiritimatiellia bacterium]HOE00134.1 hypothetical protein [Kiritimatiellia bacterium]HOE37421.1 hypothetical protein [Kiritimatiellia bacterium]